jgi:ABC-type sugar transport system ATPase subunit
LTDFAKQPDSVVLFADRVAKTYPPATQALVDVSLQLHEGRVHGLVGANGAGKSTLTKILCGVTEPTSGSLWLRGHGRLTLTRPSDAARFGIGVVHQELPLLGNLSAADNVVLGQHDGGLVSPMRRKAARDLYEQTAQHFPDAPPANARVEELSIDQRQIVAIIRALAAGAVVIMLDEPTSSLRTSERSALHGMLRRVAARGVAVLYVSHYLDDVLAVSDEVTVVRDGAVALAAPVSDLSVGALIGAMTGGAAAVGGDRDRSDAGRSATKVLELRELFARGAGPVTASVAAGEIVGLYGLQGCGGPELLEAIYGVRPHLGSVVLDGASLRRATRERIAAGLGYVSGDRGRALIADWSVSSNVGLPAVACQPLFSLVRRKREVKAAVETVDRFAIRGTAQQQLGSLSGGNQQKAAVGRWLVEGVHCLLADDLTRGVDAAGRAAIHRTLREYARAGNAVVAYSSDPEELVALCDRVLVMADGRVTREIEAEELTVETIEAATRVKPNGIAA